MRNKKSAEDYVTAVLRDKNRTNEEVTFHPTCFDVFCKEKIKLASSYYSYEILANEVVRPAGDHQGFFSMLGQILQGRSSGAGRFRRSKENHQPQQIGME